MVKNNRQQGFSLFEMIVVLAIVGIITMYNVTKLTQEIQSKVSIKAGEEVGYFTDRLYSLVSSGLLDGTGVTTFNNFEFIKLDTCTGNAINGIPANASGALNTEIPLEFNSSIECGFPLQISNGATFFDDGTIVELDLDASIVSINIDLRPVLVGPEPTIDIINMLDGLDLYLSRKGLALGVGTDIRVVPMTLNQIATMIDDFAADPTEPDNFPIMTITMDMRLTSELLSDGSRRLNSGASLCWDVRNMADVLRRACLRPELNAAGDSITFQFFDGLDRTFPVNLDLSSGGTLITQKSVVNGATNGFISSTPVINYLVMSNDNIQKPVCPDNLNPRIATALSAVTSSNRSTPTQWGDDDNSAPDYGQSGYLGIAGSGWETITIDNLEFWTMESFVAATGLDDPDDSSETNTRIMVSVWCEE